MGLLTGSVAEFTERAPGYKERLASVVSDLRQWLENNGLNTAHWFTEEQVQLGAVMDLVGTTFKGVAAVFSNVILVLLTMIFILAEAAGFRAKLGVALGSRQEYLDRASKIRTDVQRYLGIKTLVSLFTGTLVGFWVGVLGLDFPLLWGMLAFFMHFIPNLGAFLAAIPAVLLALVQLGPGKGLPGGPGIHRHPHDHRELPGAVAHGSTPGALGSRCLPVVGFLGVGLGAGGHAPLGAHNHDRQDHPGEQHPMALDRCSVGCSTPGLRAWQRRLASHFKTLDKTVRCPYSFKRTYQSPLFPRGGISCSGSRNRQTMGFSS